VLAYPAPSISSPQLPALLPDLFTSSRTLGVPSLIMSETQPSKRGKPPALEVVEPLGKRVLIRKDDDKKQTKLGIHLPDKIEIPTITGRVVAVAALIEKEGEYPIKRYDRVLFNPKHAIPVDFEGDNKLFVVPVEDVVAVFRKAEDSDA